MSKSILRERGKDPKIYTRWDLKRVYFFYRRSYFDIDWETHEARENSFIDSIFDRTCERLIEEFKINF